MPKTSKELTEEATEIAIMERFASAGFLLAPWVPEFLARQPEETIQRILAALSTEKYSKLPVVDFQTLADIMGRWLASSSKRSKYPCVPIRKGDIMFLPERFARILIDKGVARKLGDREPEREPVGKNKMGEPYERR